ncbi:S1 RNA-binding domain-containing protein, partial [Crocinitomicaceae bacterium]|nr:S1 RNA-binding domain-containing protein [Crocinitomicaceae bacterium]
AKKKSTTTEALVGSSELLNGLKHEDFSEIDAFTFKDVVEELKKPGRDPRQQAKILEFDHRLKTIDDVQPGMTLNGIVTNVTNFGAFVNIGIKENGLIHKSQLADHYVEDPSEYISLHEHVEVQVLEVDLGRKRIGLRKV